MHDVLAPLMIEVCSRKVFSMVAHHSVPKRTARSAARRSTADLDAVAAPLRRRCLLPWSSPLGDRQVDAEACRSTSSSRPGNVPLLGIGALGDVAWRRGRRRPRRGIRTIWSLTSSDDMISRRCSKITLRWSFSTSSYFREVLADFEVARSTFCCAFSSALLIQGWTMASPCPSAQPRQHAVDALGAEDAHQIVLAATGRTWNAPGSPWRPERPRSWLSMRRLSWRSVPTM